MAAVYSLPAKVQNQRRQSASTLSLDGTAQKIVHEAINGALRSYIVNEAGNFPMTSSTMLLQQSGPTSLPAYKAVSDNEWLTYKASLGKNSSLPRLALFSLKNTQDFTTSQSVYHSPTSASYSNDYLRPLSRSDNENAFDNPDYNFVPISDIAAVQSTAYQNNVDDFLTLLDSQLDVNGMTSSGVRADVSKAVTLAIGEDEDRDGRRRTPYQTLSDLPPIGSVRLGSYVPKSLQGQGPGSQSLPPLPVVTSPREGRKVFSNQPIVTEGKSYVIDDMKGGVGAPLYGTESSIVMSVQEVLNLYIFNHPTNTGQDTRVVQTAVAPTPLQSVPPPPRYLDYDLDLPDGGYLSETSYSKQKFEPFVIHNKQTQTAGDSQRKKRLSKKRVSRRNMATNTDGSVKSRYVNSSIVKRRHYLSDVGVQTDVDDDSDDVIVDVTPPRQQQQQQQASLSGNHNDQVQVRSATPLMRWTVERTVESSTPVPQQQQEVKLHSSVMDAYIEPYKVAHLHVDLTDSESVAGGRGQDKEEGVASEEEEELIETVIIEEREQRIIMEVKEELELQLQRTKQSRDAADVTDGDGRAVVDPFWLPDKYTATVDRRMQRRTRTEQVNKVADGGDEADGGALHEAIRAAVAQQASDLTSRDFMAEHTPPSDVTKQLQDASVPARKITVRRAKTDDESSEGEGEDSFTEDPVTSAGDIETRVALPKVFRHLNSSSKSKSKGGKVGREESLRRLAIRNEAIKLLTPDVSTSTISTNTDNKKQPMTSELTSVKQPVTSASKISTFNMQPVTSSEKKSNSSSKQSVRSEEEVKEEIIVPGSRPPADALPPWPKLEYPTNISRKKNKTSLKSKRESTEPVYDVISGMSEAGTVKSSQGQGQWGAGHTEPKQRMGLPNPPPPPPLPPTLPWRTGSKTSQQYSVRSNDYTTTPSKTDPVNISLSKQRESSGTDSDAFDIESILNCAREAEFNNNLSSSAGEEYMTSSLQTRHVQDAQGNWVRVSQVHQAAPHQVHGWRPGLEELPDCEYMSVNPCDSFSTNRYIAINNTPTVNGNQVKVEVVRSHSQKRNNSASLFEPAEHSPPVASPASESTISERKLSREEFLAKRNMFEKHGFYNTESTPF